MLKKFTSDLWHNVTKLIYLTVGFTAYMAGSIWLSYFSEQVTLESISLASGLVLLLLIIICVVAWNSLSAARSNPINYLKNAS